MLCQQPNLTMAGVQGKGAGLGTVYAIGNVESDLLDQSWL